MYALGCSYVQSYAISDFGLPTPLAPQIISGAVWNALPRVGQALDVSPGVLSDYFPGLTSNTFEIFEGDPAGSGVSIYGPDILPNVRAYMAAPAQEGAVLYLRWTVANSEGSATAIVAAAGAVLPALAAAVATLNVDLTGRSIRAWLSGITGHPVPSPAVLDSFAIDNGSGSVEVSGSVSGVGSVGDPWTFTVASDANDLNISITASLDNGVDPVWSDTDSTLTVFADLSLPVALDQAPLISGAGLAGETLSSDASDSWTYGGDPAMVTAREYRLLIDSVVVDGPQTAAAVSIPAGSAGASYTFQVRVILAEGSGAQSDWVSIATGNVTEASAVPNLTASDTLAGRTLTIAVDGLTGAPQPSFALTALTRDGTDILSEATGVGPWSYAVPSSETAQIVAWEVTATSSAGTDVASGSETIAADLLAPSATLNVDLTERVVTVWLTAISGVPTAITTLDVFTAAGSDVTGGVTGSGTQGDPWRYVVPASGSVTDIVIGASLDNGVIPAWSATDSTISVPSDHTAPIVTVALAQPTYTDGEIVDAADILPAISTAGNPALQLTDLTGILMVDGTQVSLPHTAVDGELLVPRMTASHPTGAIDVTGSGVTVLFDFRLTETANAELEITDATGTVTVTVTSPAGYASYDTGNGPGVFIFNSNNLASGPVNLAPPQVISDGSPAMGETLTITPGLSAYDPDNGGIGTPTYQWTRDGVAIPGATSSSYTLVADDDNTNIRVGETLADNAGTRTTISAPLSVGTLVSAAINAITYDTAGAVIDYTGTLIITYDTAGALLEAT